MSYCWRNSKIAADINDIEKASLVSSNHAEYADPRKIHAEISKYIAPEEIWLDVERLENNNSVGIYQQIAKGVGESQVVLLFISSEYAQSKNCIMEAQFKVVLTFCGSYPLK